MHATDGLTDVYRSKKCNKLIEALHSPSRLNLLLSTHGLLRSERGPKVPSSSRCAIPMSVKMHDFVVAVKEIDRRVATGPPAQYTASNSRGN